MLSQLQGSCATIFSAIKPTGRLHLGNYLGAIKNWVDLQKVEQLDNLPIARRIYAIADLHALTVPRKPEQLQQDTLEMAITLLACGIDPEKSLLIRQSKLAGMIQWKEASVLTKSQSGLAGMLIYPVLQAADILLYQTTHVPVGQDQTQHLELAVDLASKFNTMYKGGILKVPKILERGPKIMSLRDARKKMSKSDIGQDASCLYLTDAPEVIERKIMAAATDTIPYITYDPTTRSNMANLLEIYAYAAQFDIKDIVASYDGQCGNFARFKDDLSKHLQTALAPIRQRYVDLSKDPHYIYDILQKGEVGAREYAQKTLASTLTALGL